MILCPAPFHLPFHAGIWLAKEQPLLSPRESTVPTQFRALIANLSSLSLSPFSYPL